MSRALLLGLALLVLANCGIRRPLIPPSDIPAYEASIRKKHERLTQQQENATAPGVQPNVETAQ